jgi:hypothetical protein
VPLVLKAYGIGGFVAAAELANELRALTVLQLREEHVFSWFKGFIHGSVEEGLVLFRDVHAQVQVRVRTHSNSQFSVVSNRGRHLH